MLDEKTLSGLINSEMNDQDREYWFSCKRQKFLHNIDTFYYSVKLQQDFTADSTDPAVLAFRKYFDTQYEVLEGMPGLTRQLHYSADADPLNILPYTYGKYYNVWLEYPEFFDIILARKVPKSPDGIGSLTCEGIVQIRSFYLWLYGVEEAFRRSYEVLKGVLQHFNLSVDFVQENRVDYCWHTNYFANPVKFFTAENFYKMRVDRYGDANFHTAKVGSEGYEVDYIALGKRSCKCFIRIYLKSKEVIQEGYKAFFLRTWLFHGLINRYDLYVYESAYRRASWEYVTIARLEFYMEYGADAQAKAQCGEMVRQYHESMRVSDPMIRLADALTPQLNLVINVEYQTMRRSTKSYCLVPVKDNSRYGEAQRIYDYFNNHKIIIDYLTHDTFRLVEKNSDVNKSRRDYCPFWAALRRCWKVDLTAMPDELRLRREYNRKLNGERVKEQMINKTVTYGIYLKGINEDGIEDDCMLPIMMLNDNDIMRAKRYKRKRLRQFSPVEFASAAAPDVLNGFDVQFIERSTGCIYDTPAQAQRQGENADTPGDEGGDGDDTRPRT